MTHLENFVKKFTLSINSIYLTPQQNVVIEREKKNIMKMTMCMLHKKRFVKKVVVNTVVFFAEYDQSRF